MCTLCLQLGELRKRVIEYPEVHITLCGVIGAGKSSFVNMMRSSVESVPVSQAGTGNGTGSFTKNNTRHTFRVRNKPLQWSVTDAMGDSFSVRLPVCLCYRSSALITSTYARYHLSAASAGTQYGTFLLLAWKPLYSTRAMRADHDVYMGTCTRWAWLGLALVSAKLHVHEPALQWEAHCGTVLNTTTRMCVLVIIAEQISSFLTCLPLETIWQISW